VLGVLLLSAGSLFAQDGAVPNASHHKIVPVTVNNITPERGRDFLARLRIGTTVSRLPDTHTLLLTGSEGEMQKALAVLDLVDTRTEFEVREVGPAWPAMASNSTIAQAVGGICIGTFANPPRDKSKMRAIIDVHNGNVVIVAPVMQFQDVRVALELGPAVLTQRKAVANTVVSPRVETVLSTAMLESMVDGRPESLAQVPSDGAVAATSRQPMNAKQIQEKLEEMRRQANAIEALRRANGQAGRTSLATSPVADPNETEPPIPDGLSQVGAPPDANTLSEDSSEPSEDESAGEPAAAEPVVDGNSLPVEDAVPSGTDRITEPKIEPKSLSQPMNASKVTTQIAPPTWSETSTRASAEAADGEEILHLTLPEKLPVIDLLDLAGKHLNLSYLYDPAKVSGEVTLKLNGGLKGQMKKKDLYLLLEAALQDKDLVMTRHKGNIVRVMPKIDAKRLDPELVTTAGTSAQLGNAVVQQVFKLKHIDSDSAKNLIEGMDLAISIIPVTESKKLIVTAYAHRMTRIEDLLDLVDQPGVPRRFRYRQLRYTMAKTLADKVKALAEQLENVSVTIGTSSDAADMPTPAKQPGESDVAYRTRLAQIRAAQTAARAQAASRGQTGQAPKPGVYLDADERTNRILMIGEDEQLTTVEELVDALDIAQQDLQALQLYRIKHVDAEEVARKLQELGIIRKIPETSASMRSSQSSSRITGQTAAQARTQQQAAGAEPAAMTGTELTEEGLVSEPQVVVVESNNSLLVNGTPEQHAKIASIISYVDSEMDLEEIPYKIYPLENSSPDHLAEILQSLIEESTEQTRDKDGKIEKVVTKRQEEIAIVPDPNTYSLIVYASKKNQEWIQTLVKQLDKRRPQVLIDVTLVEVSKTDEFVYDLNVVQSVPGLANTSGIIDALTSAQPTKGRFTEMQSDSGTFTGFYGDSHINALLRAMESKNYGRVLAKPKILVNDNQQGTINTKEKTYVKITSSSLPSEGSQLVQTSTNYQDYEAGVELTITPHISEGDMLGLNILLNRTDFREMASSEVPPDTTSSEILTNVTVPDGSTIILGGMVKLNQTKGGGKVPILGDIPLIGGLFRSINNSGSQSRLYVFVKAEIIRPEAGIGHGMKGLTEISDKHRMAFEKQEMEFHGYQDWPGVKPSPVDPPKVLDVQ
jgi:type II secretory pathway component GspD/PulD (secretin)